MEVVGIDDLVQEEVLELLYLLVVMVMCFEIFFQVDGDEMCFLVWLYLCQLVQVGVDYCVQCGIFFIGYCIVMQDDGFEFVWYLD